MLEGLVMHEDDIFGFVIFFWSFFIYKLFSSELRFIFYEFSKFYLFSGIFYNYFYFEINWIIARYTQKLDSPSRKASGARQVKVQLTAQSAVNWDSVDWSNWVQVGTQLSVDTLVNRLI